MRVIIIPLATRTAQQDGQPRNEARHLSHILRILLAELSQGCPFLAMRQAHVHEDENREHRQREQRRPLQQEAEHDEDEADILRMADIGVDAGRHQPTLALRLVKRLPSDEEEAADCKEAGQHKRNGCRHQGRSS